MAVTKLQELFTSHGLKVKKADDGHRPLNDIELEVQPHVIIESSPVDLSHHLVLVKELLQDKLNCPLELTPGRFNIYVNGYARLVDNTGAIEVGGWPLTDEEWGL